MAEIFFNLQMDDNLTLMNFVKVCQSRSIIFFILDKNVNFQKDTIIFDINWASIKKLLFEVDFSMR